MALAGSAREPAWRERVFSALHEQGRTLDEPDLLAALARDLGFAAHDFAGAECIAELEAESDRARAAEVAGVPPLPAGVDSIGRERRGVRPEQIARVKEAYRLLYRRGLRREEALEKIIEGGRDEVAEVYEEFFSRATRGIVR